MKKIIKYVQLLPLRAQQYGCKTLFYKIIVDFFTYFKLSSLIPPGNRWLMAHSFHTSWKKAQQEMYGLDGYNDRIDAKSREVLINFYEVGLNFTGKTFADIGCGTRGVLPIIKAKKKIGVDPTISKVKTNYTHDEIDVYYLSEKAEEISLPDESVDIVCCNNALNHFENPELALAQIHRILKPGGRLLIEVFIEQTNIAHTVEFTPLQLNIMVSKLFDTFLVKHERLQVTVEIDENMDGHLPMRWGGVFVK